MNEWREWWAPLSVSSVDDARRWLAEQLPMLGDEHRADVLLVAGELVADSYERGGGMRKLRIQWRPGPNEVRIEVDSWKRRIDSAHEGDSVPVGLALLDRVARAWGTSVAADSSSVTTWAVVGGRPT